MTRFPNLYFLLLFELFLFRLSFFFVSFYLFSFPPPLHPLCSFPVFLVTPLLHAHETYKYIHRNTHEVIHSHTHTSKRTRTNNRDAHKHTQTHTRSRTHGREENMEEVDPRKARRRPKIDLNPAALLFISRWGFLEAILTLHHGGFILAGPSGSMGAKRHVRLLPDTSSSCFSLALLPPPFIHSGSLRGRKRGWLFPHAHPHPWAPSHRPTAPTERQPSPQKRWPGPEQRQRAAGPALWLPTYIKQESRSGVILAPSLAPWVVLLLLDAAPYSKRVFLTNELTGACSDRPLAHRHWQRGNERHCSPGQSSRHCSLDCGSRVGQDQHAVAELRARSTGFGSAALSRDVASLRPLPAAARVPQRPALECVVCQGRLCLEGAARGRPQRRRGMQR